MRFLEFLRALLRHWWASMSSAILSILAIYAAWRNETNRWSFYVSCAAAVAMFLIAAFLAWNEEHNNLAAAEAKVAELESEDHKIRVRRDRAELERLEEQNRRGAEVRAQEHLDKRLAAFIREQMNELRQRNERHSNMQAYSNEWCIKAAEQIGISGDEIRASMQRLYDAGQMPTLQDLILNRPPGEVFRRPR
jgi:hypothetical protein